MTGPIESVSRLGGAIRSPELSAAAPAPGQGAFEAVLADAVGRVEQFRRDAGQSVEAFLSGEDEDLHRVITQVQRAELAFEMFLEVRNKVVQAYQEVMRMQL